LIHWWVRGLLWGWRHVAHDGHSVGGVLLFGLGAVGYALVSAVAWLLILGFVGRGVTVTRGSVSVRVRRWRIGRAPSAELRAARGELAGALRAYAAVRAGVGVADAVPDGGAGAVEPADGADAGHA
jgi:hypothetical protein